MDVTFTKASGRRYFMTVVRERGARLAPRQGPGYDDRLPHDAVHFIVESEAALAGGVFGRLARGESNMFVAADPDRQRRVARREARRSRHPEDRADMARSEALASISVPVWELRRGYRAQLPVWAGARLPSVTPDDLLERIIERLDDFAARWTGLPVGGGVTLHWSLPAGRRFVNRAAGRASKTRRPRARTDRLT
jgi:hypothetical protein